MFLLPREHSTSAQLRADEQQLRQKRSGDVMDRLLKIIEEEKKKRLPKRPPSDGSLSAEQEPENVELEPQAQRQHKFP